MLHVVTLYSSKEDGGLFVVEADDATAAIHKVANLINVPVVRPVVEQDYQGEHAWLLFDSVERAADHNPGIEIGWGTLVGWATPLRTDDNLQEVVCW